jgi:hypothetical protein
VFILSFVRLLVDADEGLQEQVWGVVRHLSKNEPGIDMVFTEFDSETLVSQLTVTIGSENEDVLIQVRFSQHTVCIDCHYHDEDGVGGKRLANGSQTQQNFLVSHKASTWRSEIVFGGGQRQDVEAGRVVRADLAKMAPISASESLQEHMTATSIVTASILVAADTLIAFLQVT